MKINKILYTIILLMLVIIINPNFALAGQGNQVMTYDGDGYTGTTDTSITGDSDKGYPTIDNTYKPTANLGSAQSIITTILSFLTVLGIVAVVVGIALIGFGSILGSAGEKAEAQTKLVGVVIAGIVITSGSVLAKFIISVAETI